MISHLLKQRTGEPLISFHSLRHTFISLARIGVKSQREWNEMSVRAGHASNLETLRTYTNLYEGILWARGHALRTHALPVSERFADTPMVTDRLLLTPWLSEAVEPIVGEAPDALEELHRQLEAQGQAVVTLPPDAALLNRIMAFAATVPVQLEYLNVYPRLSSVVRGQGTIALHFELEATA